MEKYNFFKNVFYINFNNNILMNKSSQNVLRTIFYDKFPRRIPMKILDIIYENIILVIFINIHRIDTLSLIGIWFEINNNININF